MAIFDFLSKTAAEKSPTARRLRGAGVAQGTATADDFEIVLTGIHEGTVRFLQTQAGIQLGPVDQAKIRTILRENLDPKNAHSKMEADRKATRLAEIRQEMQAALAGFAPAAPAQGMDQAAMAQMIAQTVAATMAPFLAALRQPPAQVAAANPPAPAQALPVVATNPDEVIVFDGSNV